MSGVKACDVSVTGLVSCVRLLAMASDRVSDVFCLGTARITAANRSLCLTYGSSCAITKHI